MSQLFLRVSLPNCFQRHVLDHVSLLGNDRLFSGRSHLDRGSLKRRRGFPGIQHLISPGSLRFDDLPVEHHGTLDFPLADLGLQALAAGVRTTPTSSSSSITWADRIWPFRIPGAGKYLLQ
jgi:hypothetical protein